MKIAIKADVFRNAFPSETENALSYVYDNIEAVDDKDKGDVLECVTIMRNNNSEYIRSIPEILKCSGLPPTSMFVERRSVILDIKNQKIIDGNNSRGKITQIS